MKKRSLKFKLITGSLIAVMLPLIIIGFFSIDKASKALVHSGKSQVKQVAKDLANMTELVLESFG